MKLLVGIECVSQLVMEHKIIWLIKQWHCILIWPWTGRLSILLLWKLLLFFFICVYTCTYSWKHMPISILLPFTQCGVIDVFSFCRTVSECLSEIELLGYPSCHLVTNVRHYGMALVTGQTAFKPNFCVNFPIGPQYSSFCPQSFDIVTVNNLTISVSYSQKCSALF